MGSLGVLCWCVPWRVQGGGIGRTNKIGGSWWVHFLTSEAKVSTGGPPDQASALLERVSRCQKLRRIDARD